MSNTKVALFPLATEDAPSDREWTDIEWLRNQWYLAIDDACRVNQKLAEAQAEIKRLHPR